MAAYQSELAVITKAKDLCSYVMTVTDKSPKRFRFTLVAKLQNYALDIIENLYRANEVFVKAGDREKAQQRIDFQHQALTELKLLGYMDDLILLHEDKEHLKACLAEIRAFAQDRLKLEFNEKTQIFPVSEGVDYLGWRFYLTDTGKVIRRLRTSNKRRFKRRLKAFQEKYRSGEMDHDAIKRSLASYNGHLKHGHTWKLKTKVYGNFVLTKAPKGEATAIPGETPENA